MKSEFAALYDLAVAKGFSNSELISEINGTVLNKFRDENPKSPSDATVFVNSISGDVRIFSGDKDITPDNTIESHLIADAEIAYTGKGNASTGSRPGFFTRLINWIF